MARITRRLVLGGVLGGMASAAFGNAPARSQRPVARTGIRVATSGAASAARAADLIGAAGLGGEVAYVVADAKTGLILEARQGGKPMPPASTMKVITSLYALEHLGAGYRFPTRLVATGPVQGGKIRGDLILAGGGDPELTTDDLGDMAVALNKAGMTGVTGRFLVWGGALPYLEAIDRGQPDWLGYNPAVSGLNLNFNRVNFVWKRAGGGYEVGMDARAERFAPPVYSARVKVADRDLPVFAYRNGGRVEEWTVARRALGKGGSRWLPVRRPELYAGDVFQTLARAQGVPLPAPEEVKRMPGGSVLVERVSEELPVILRDMMKYSTNMTAEAVGMAASARRGVTSHIASGPEMAGWLKARTGATSARCADHSGLAGASRISAEDMVRALVTLGPGAGLRGLMKEVPFRDEGGRKISGHPAKVEAKTGTLNFVSTLAGYVRAPGDTDLAFAIFTGDVARRDSVPEAQRERPEGGAAWVKRSKRLQQQLIERWVTVYGV
ncbi:MAG: D-alanyl-D-alanine carboxypeptidase [Rhodobacterales bacterium 32-67-9]|nr:MAG: D-alanyl-D-alanine carboxypeptidase [Rhodobacterales bacterium 32-67-9]